MSLFFFFFLISPTLFCLLQLKSEASCVLEVCGGSVSEKSWALSEIEKRTEWTEKLKAPVKRQELNSPLNFRAEFTCKFLIAAYAILILCLACINKKCNTLIVLIKAVIECLLKAYNSYSSSCSVDELGLEAVWFWFLICIRRVLNWACSPHSGGGGWHAWWHSGKTNQPTKEGPLPSPPRHISGMGMTEQFSSSKIQYLIGFPERWLTTWSSWVDLQLKLPYSMANNVLFFSLCVAFTWCSAASIIGQLGDWGRKKTNLYFFQNNFQFVVLQSNL